MSSSLNPPVMITCRISILVALLLFCPGNAFPQLFRSNEERLAERAENRIGEISDLFEKWSHTGRIAIDSIVVNRDENILYLYLNSRLVNIPMRDAFVQQLRNEIGNRLGFRFRNYHIVLYAGGRIIEDYIPNFFRETGQINNERIFKPHAAGPLVRKKGHNYPEGLTGTHIALWPGHGYYFEAARNRWEWQRARLYGTVEDMFTFSFVQPYLVPMLENAGAYVMLPRERDIQTNEVIVAAGGSTGESEMIITNGNSGSWIREEGRGFLISDTLYQGDNPFSGGSWLRIHTDGNKDASVSFIPDIPEEGEYAVYVSWVRFPGNMQEVKYVVNHSGGSQAYFVDQTIGGSTWIYLGTHHFYEGLDPYRGSVILSVSGDQPGYITADAVRFGGGMGNVARKPLPAGEERLPAEKTPEALSSSINMQLSGRPRYMEAARYFLQYAGMPDSTVYSITMGKYDYNDDFMARGEWINYLTGAPMGVTGKPAPDSPMIPLDIALAFHTDAGLTPCDSLIGTLAIYSSEDPAGIYFNGTCRLAARDLADIVQTQLVDDFRLMVNRQWTHRGLMNRRYSEAVRPHVPVMLLELLSHQNLADMRYGLDPRFRFLASRSVYKGILRYLSVNKGTRYVVQPLPPSGISIQKTGPMTVRLTWDENEDPLEPSAAATGYIVYKRRENSGFDNGTPVEHNYMDIEIPEKQTIFSFKVTAVNEGGESFPGEILSLSLSGDKIKPVLVVNAFTRVSGPMLFDTGTLAGIKWWDDPGVPDRYDLCHTGAQYDFNRFSPWLDDDSPGWGASRADMEGKIITGNTFDFPALYGEALRDNGHSFISTSREAFEKGYAGPGDYSFLIVIFGEQRGIPSWYDKYVSDFDIFTPGMIHVLKNWIYEGSGIMISGSYLGTDMVERNDSKAIEFASEYLGFTWRTNHACNTGKVTATDHCPVSFPPKLKFNTTYHPDIYSVPAPDALEPEGDNAKVIYRYASNMTNAGILKTMPGHSRILSLGFPFESIICPDQRKEMLKGIIPLLQGNDPDVPD